MPDVIFGTVGHWAATRRQMAVLGRLVRRFVRCEDCHCTEERACHSGCAWNPAYLRLDRYICTACRPIGEGP